MLTAEPVDKQQSLLLTNADIAFDSELFRLLPTLDSFGVYYGHRMDIEAAASNPNQLAPRGIYEWGFDYFIVPQAFSDALKSTGAFPAEFLVGEPWWDYALPVAAVALGFPLKRLTTPKPLAFHYAHPARYDEQKWLANGDRFIDFARRLLERGPSSASGLLTDIVNFPGDREARLRGVAQLICQSLP
jgi:hypothetical protein